MKHLNWRQTAVFSFMLIVSLGFLVPFNIQLEETTQPIICKTDAECILNCGQQVTGYCTNNMCSISSCDDDGTTLLPPKKVSMLLVQGDNTYNLADYIPNDIFVSAQDGNVLLSGDVPLTHILQRAGIDYYNGCINSVFVNGCQLNIIMDDQNININNHPNLYESTNILIEVQDGY